MISHVDHKPESPLPLLVTGVAGVAGYNAFHYFKEKHPGRVFGMRQVNNWRLGGPGIIPCDAEDRQSLRRIVHEHEFAAVLYCAGNCALKSCELDPALAWRTNVEGVEAMLDALKGTGTRLVQMSIDLVYSGGHEASGDHIETDDPDPVTVYGKTMVVAERMLLRRRPDACCLRISLPMGISFNGHAGAIDWIQHRFASKLPATLYYDEVRTPTYTDCLNRVCEDILARDIAGLYHAGGPRKLSLYQIAQIVNRVGGYDPDHLMGCPRIDAGPMPPRAGNVTMDSSLLADALGYEPFDPWPLEDRYVPTHRDWHRERRCDWQGSPELLAEVLYNNPALKV